jgi:hypothetical protein
MKSIPCRVCETGTLRRKRVGKHGFAIRLVGLVLLFPILFWGLSFLAARGHKDSVVAAPAIQMMHAVEMITERFHEGDSRTALAMTKSDIVLFAFGSLVLSIVGLMCVGTRVVLRCTHCGATVSGE